MQTWCYCGQEGGLMQKLKDITPEEEKLIKELQKLEIKKIRRREKLLDEFLWGAAKYGNYDGVLKR